jgi:hypothetical protein
MHCTDCIFFTFSMFVNLCFFFFAVCIMLRVDSTSIESVSSKIVMALEGAKLASICPTKSHYSCLRSEELNVSRNSSLRQ